MQRILIVGGGVGGLALANRLSARLGRKRKAEIALVDHSPMHVWKPMLHEFAAGTAEPSDRGINFPVQARRRGFRFIPGTLTSIDRVSNSIEVALPRSSAQHGNVRRFEFDRLVLAIGGRANDFGTPGAKEHCLLVDDLKSALALNDALRAEILERAFSNEDIRIAIVGGGATGVELAAEIRKLIAIGSSYGIDHLESLLKVTLIEANERILKAFDEVSAKRVEDKLRSLGVRIECERRVTEVDAAGFVFSDGRRIDAALKVWAAGVAAPPALKTLDGVELNRSGQALVDEHLRVQGTLHIFAMGDCCSFMPRGEDLPLPATGQVASQQATFLATALEADLDGRALPAFEYEDRGGLVSLGMYGGFGSLPNKGFVPEILISGRWARFIHPLFFRAHMFQMLGFWRGALSWLRDTITAWLHPGIRF
ncbi:MAG: NAD(P)/FAD-dependent oxidoreductase [Pseudomonadota bacterium]